MNGTHLILNVIFRVGKVRMSLEAQERYSIISEAVVLSLYSYRRDKRKTRNRKWI